MNTLNVTGDAGETRRTQSNARVNAIQQLNGPSRQVERTPANLGKLEEGAVPTPGLAGELPGPADVDSPAWGDGAADFEHLAEIVTYGIYQSVSCLNEKSRPEAVAMLRRIIVAERAVLDAADALLATRELSIARAVGGAA